MTEKSTTPKTPADAEQLAAELLAELPEQARQLAAEVLAADEGELKSWMTGEAGPTPFRVRFIEPPLDA